MGQDRLASFTMGSNPGQGSDAASRRSIQEHDVAEGWASGPDIIAIEAMLRVQAFGRKNHASADCVGVHARVR
jgi:hypothetical protein